MMVIFSNVNGFGVFNVNPVSDNLGYTNKYIPQTTNETTSTSISTGTKKDFADTTVGKITDQLFGAFDKFLQNKELDVRKAEAQAGQIIATTQGGAGSTPPPPKR